MIISGLSSKDFYQVPLLIVRLRFSFGFSFGFLCPISEFFFLPLLLIFVAAYCSHVPLLSRIRFEGTRGRHAYTPTGPVTPAQGIYLDASSWVTYIITFGIGPGRGD